MKKIIAGILAVTLTISVTACGNSDESSSEKKSVTSQKETIENEDEKGPEEIIKQITQKKIDAVINNDFYAFYELVPDQFWMKWDIAEGDFTQDKVTTDMIEEYDEDTLEMEQEEFDRLKQKLDGTGVTSDIYDFKITKIEYEDSMTTANAEFILKGSSGNISGSVECASVKNEWFVSINISRDSNDADNDDETESEENEYENVEDDTDLKTANSNAKSVYTAISGYIADRETMGYSKEDTLSKIEHEFDCGNAENYNEATREIIKTLNNYGCSGIIYIDSFEDGFYTQWKQSYDSETVGQFPNPNSDFNNNYGWGYYNN